MKIDIEISLRDVNIFALSRNILIFPVVSTLACSKNTHSLIFKVIKFVSSSQTSSHDDSRIYEARLRQKLARLLKNKRFDETQRENNIFTRTLFLHRGAIYAHRNSMACYLTEIKRELISANIYSPRMEKEEKRREEGEESPFHILSTQIKQKKSF